MYGGGSLMTGDTVGRLQLWGVEEGGGEAGEGGVRVVLVGGVEVEGGVFSAAFDKSLELVRV